MTLLVQGDDDIGYDDLDMGAWGGRRRRRRAMPGRSMSMIARPVSRARSVVTPDQPGAPSRRLGLYPAAFPTVSFALADGTATKSVQMNPQTAFKGQRIFVQVIRSGTSAALTAPLITQLQIGVTPAIITPDGIPAEAFIAGSFDTNIMLPPTEPGVLYQLSVRLPVALTTTDTILLIVGILGTGWQ